MIFEQYILESKRLKLKYAAQIEIFIGMETEMCSPQSLENALALFSNYQLDYMVGSVHHVRGIPIDFSLELYAAAEMAACSTEALFVEYFEAVESMCARLKPTIVGHFDLIRMFRPSQHITPLILAAAEKVSSLSCNQLRSFVLSY